MEMKGAAPVGHIDPKHMDPLELQPSVAFLLSVEEKNIFCCSKA